jgi:16S rRNA (uracil1498-N3)-methyltransferase
MNLFNEIESNVVENLVIKGDQLHHFRNVLRGKLGDKVKVFDGKGLILEGVVEALSKKELSIRVEAFIKPMDFDTVESLTIGVPKKEYLESIVRSSIQIGVKEINLVQTKHSPWVYKSYSRLDKIMISALLQSENPYLPKLNFFESLQDFLKLEFKTLLFSTELESVTDLSMINEGFKNIFIGPEGGFHPSELKEFERSDKVTCARLSAPIMKAEIAVPYCLGLSRSLN